MEGDQYEDWTEDLSASRSIFTTMVLALALSFGALLGIALVAWAVS